MRLQKILRKNKKIYALYEKSLVKKVYGHIKSRRERLLLQRYGKRIVHEVMDISKKNNLGIFCVYGTLLGIIRENGLIAHDDDLDFGVVDDDGFDYSLIEDAFVKRGYKKIKEFVFEGRVTEQTYHKAGLDIDFFSFFPLRDKEGHFITYVFFRDKEKIYMNPYEHNVRYYDNLTDINKTIWINFDGSDVLVLQDSEDYLEKIYGNKWKVRDPYFKSLAKILPDDQKAEVRLF